MRLAADPDGFAQELARPMPRPPQPAARRGTRFHAWVESRFEELPLPMLGPDELPGGDDGAEIADERDLAALKEAFERTPYARPHALPRRGAVPAHPRRPGDPRPDRRRLPRRTTATATYEIVDWKTSRTRTADPLQLAVYRLAWAEQHGRAPGAVTAAFLYVRSGEIVRPTAPARTGPGAGAASCWASRPDETPSGPDRLDEHERHPGQRRPHVHRARTAPPSSTTSPSGCASRPCRPSPSTPADVRRSADWLAAKLKETGFPVTEVWETRRRARRLRRVALRRPATRPPSSSTATTTCSPPPARTAGTPTPSSR